MISMNSDKKSDKELLEQYLEQYAKNLYNKELLRF